MQKNSGTARADAVGTKSLQDLVEGGKDAAGRVEGRNVEVGFLNSRGARGPWGAAMEVAEGAAAQGRRLAFESAGLDVTTFLEFVQGAFSCLYLSNGYPPPPPRG